MLLGPNHPHPGKVGFVDVYNAPLPGAAGDLARSCDEQLLDVFLAINRILDERVLLVERRDRESEREESAERVPATSLLMVRNNRRTAWR